jgi:hypothetical protein
LIPTATGSELGLSASDFPSRQLYLLRVRRWTSSAEVDAREAGVGGNA